MTERKATIVVIEKDEEIGNLIKFVLEEASYHVIHEFPSNIKRNTPSIDSIVQQFHPKVILFDIEPPFVESIDYLKKLKQLPTLLTQSFILTSIGSKEEIDNLIYKELGQVRILHKPFEVQELTNLVKEVLEEQGRAQKDIS